MALTQAPAQTLGQVTGRPRGHRGQPKGLRDAARGGFLPRWRGASDAPGSGQLGRARPLGARS